MYTTVPFAPDRIASPPAERRTRPVPVPSDPTQRALHFALLDEQMHNRRPAAEVDASLALFAVTR
jgi:hypothetical protein